MGAEWIAPGFALLFACSGLNKLLDMRGFRRAIAGFGLQAVRSRSAIRFSAHAVAAAEMCLALCFAAGFVLAWAYLLALLLLSVFTLLLLRASLLNLHVACHCFGRSGSRTNLNLAVARNVLLMALLVLGLLWSLDSSGVWHHDRPAVVAAVAVLSLLWQAWIELRELLALRRARRMVGHD